MSNRFDTTLLRPGCNVAMAHVNGGIPNTAVDVRIRVYFIMLR